MHWLILLSFKTNNAEHIVVKDFTVKSLNHKWFVARGFHRCQQGGISYCLSSIALGNNLAAVINTGIIFINMRQHCTQNGFLHLVGSFGIALFQSFHINTK